MLSKREEQGQSNGFEGKSFVSKHAPRLLDSATQDIIYKDQSKEKELINLWSTILEAYFREVLLMSVNHFFKVLLFLELNGVQTSSLKRLLSERKLPNFALAADGQDFKQLKNALRGRNGDTLFDRLVGLFRRRPLTEDAALLVHIPSFKAAHAKFTKAAAEAVAEKELVQERELIQIASGGGQNSEFEQRIFLDIMCFDKQLSRNKLFRDIIYSRYYADDKSLPLQKGLFKYSLREILSKVKNRLETCGELKSRGNVPLEAEQNVQSLQNSVVAGADKTAVSLKSRKEKLLDFLEVLNDIQRIIDGIESNEEFDSVFAVFRYIQNKISTLDGLETYTATSITHMDKTPIQESPSVKAL